MKHKSKSSKSFASLVDIIEVDESFKQYLENPEDLQGIEVNNTNIRIWIHDKDLAKLERVVWEGNGQLLLKHTSGHAKVRKFLETVPRLLNDIREIHMAAIYGELEFVDKKEFRQQIYSAKDTNGISALHKAVVRGHRDVAEYLMDKTDRSVLKVVDRDGRSALHYAAANAQDDENGMYGWLLQIGADKNWADNFMKLPEYYLTHPALLDLGMCSVIPDAPRVAVSSAEPAKRDEATMSAVIKSKSRAKSKSKSKERKRDSDKLDKAIFTISGKPIKEEHIVKWIKTGDIPRLEYATLLGKGKMIAGKPSWNDEARSYIKKVPELMADMEAILSSADNGDLSAVMERVAKNKKLLYARDAEGLSPIHRAAKWGHVDIVKFLLNEDAEICKLLDHNKRTVLHLAARCDEELIRREIFDECVMNGADKFAKDSLGNMPEFYFFNAFPDRKTSKPLSELEKPEEESEDDSVFIDEKKESPGVEEAIQTKDFDRLVEYVLDGDAEKLMEKSSDDEEVQDFLDHVSMFQEKINKLHQAVEDGNLTDIKMLLNRKKYVLSKEKLTGVSMLHKAVVLGHADIIQFLGENFVQTLKANDSLGRTPLHYAALLNDQGDTYHQLVTFGADPNHPDQDGLTPEAYLRGDSQAQLKDLQSFVLRRRKRLFSKRATARAETRSQAELLSLQILESDRRRDTGSGDAASLSLYLDLHKKLESSFRRLLWSRDCRSFLRACLTQPVFDELKKRTTPLGANLLHHIRAGVEHLDAPIGVFAMDAFSYKDFLPLIHPIICSLNGVSPDDRQPASDWSNPDYLVPEDLDPELVESVAIQISRNVEGVPFIAMMSAQDLGQVEKSIKAVLKNVTIYEEASSFVGIYYPLTTIPKEVSRQLKREGLLFGDDDRVLREANVYHDWPQGRGIFVNRTRDTFVWINHTDHLTVTMKSDKLKVLHTFQKMNDLMAILSSDITFATDPHQFGYLTFNPADVGTALRIRVKLKLPFLSNEPQFLDELCSQHSLMKQQSDPGAKDQDHTFLVQNQRTFAITEVDILMQTLNAVKQILSFEKSMQNEHILTTLQEDLVETLKQEQTQPLPQPT